MAAENCSAPPPNEIVPEEPSALAAPTLSSPPLIFTPPLKLLLPESVRMPEPKFVRESPLPEIALASVTFWPLVSMLTA